MSRMSAEDRREQVVRAAMTEFSVRGLEGTSTSDIAKRVGVSQPYLFRLFPTKKDLFIEAVKHGGGRIRDLFTKAAEGHYGTEALREMGEAYQVMLMEDRELLNMQLQQFAACHDPEVQRAVRGVMQGVWQHVENLTGASVEDRVGFFAKGMLCNMIAAMGRDDGTDPMWQPVLDVLRDDVRPRDADTDAEADAAGRLEGEDVVDSGFNPAAEYAEYVADAFRAMPEGGDAQSADVTDASGSVPASREARPATAKRAARGDTRSSGKKAASDERRSSVAKQAARRAAQPAEKNGASNGTQPSGKSRAPETQPSGKSSGSNKAQLSAAEDAWQNAESNRPEPDYGPYRPVVFVAKEPTTD